MNNPNDVLIDSYLENDIGIDDFFLSKELSAGLQNNISQLDNKNLLHLAGIGNQNIKDDAQKMRGDKIYWLDKKNNNDFETAFLVQIETFILRLNQTCYAGINAYEFHYALYQGGTGYKRHKDQFKTDSNRKYSLINYLNPNWLLADGGQLVVYQNNIPQAIAPQAQKAIFFKSDEMEHEVSTAFKPRMSITGWLKVV
jgi:SM-20-related protein